MPDIQIRKSKRQSYEVHQKDINVSPVLVQSRRGAPRINARVKPLIIRWDEKRALWDEELRNRGIMQLRRIFEKQDKNDEETPNNGEEDATSSRGWSHNLDSINSKVTYLSIGELDALSQLSLIVAYTISEDDTVSESERQKRCFVALQRPLPASPRDWRA